MVRKRSGIRGKRIAKKHRPGNQRAYHAYGREQNGDNGKRVDRRQAEKAEKRGGGSWRLVVSAMILVSVIAVKLVAPQTLEQVRGGLLDLMGKDTDFVAVFSAVGKAVGSDEWNEKLQQFVGTGAESMILLEEKEEKYSLSKHRERLVSIPLPSLHSGFWQSCFSRQPLFHACGSPQTHNPVPSLGCPLFLVTD